MKTLVNNRVKASGQNDKVMFLKNQIYCIPMAFHKKFNEDQIINTQNQ